MASAIDRVTFSIFYDASVFNYVSALAKVSADIDVNNTRVGNRGKIDVTMRLTSTCVGFEDLIDIVFAIADPTYLEEGDRYDFEVSDVKLYDDNYIIHSSVVAQGVRPLYVVSKVSVLDFTEDGQINSADYNYVLGYLGVSKGDGAWMQASICDVNGDDLIDINDLMMVYYNMKKYD